MFRPFGIDEAVFIVAAVQWTLLLSVFAFAGGAAIGICVALARISEHPALRLPALAFVRLFQGTPLLMQIFLSYFGLRYLGLDIAPLFAAALALSLHAGAFLGEIWRGCINAVPPGQREAGWALGLGRLSIMTRIVLPQAAKIAVAPTVGFLIQLIKGTSLASVIGFVELMRAGQIINNVTYSPFKVYGLIAILYFILCWPLSVWAAKIEVNFSGSAKKQTI